MEEISSKLWKSAKPFYEKGRIYDIEQVKWMIKEAERIAPLVEVDQKILLPLIILHDIGYCFVENKNPNIKDPSSKKLHMQKGAIIAQQLLEKANYDPELIAEIVYYVSVHDNWALGEDSVYQIKIMALFNDLDFLFSMATEESFRLHGESIGKTPQEMYHFWMNDEKLTRRPFCCQETKELFENLMAERKKSLLL